MLSVTRRVGLALLCVGLLASEHASAQVSVPGGTAGLRDRGILNRLGARRDARQDRLSRPPAPNNSPAPGSARGPQALPPGQAGNPPAGNPQSGGVRSAQYAAQGDAWSRAGAEAAAATTPLPPNRLPSAGSGVTLRLPADFPGEVNFLIDETQVMAIGSGDEQHLRGKSQYEIRFSRGIDDEGRAYGEARYTITEGAYRFAVTDKGWELYRESAMPKPSASIVPQPLQAGSSPASPPPVVPEPLGPSQLSQLRHREPGNAAEPAASGPLGTLLPTSGGESIEAGESETLPTPTLRSILERE